MREWWYRRLVPHSVQGKAIWSGALEGCLDPCHNQTCWRICLITGWSSLKHGSVADDGHGLPVANDDAARRDGEPNDAAAHHGIPPAACDGHAATRHDDATAGNDATRNDATRNDAVSGSYGHGNVVARHDAVSGSYGHGHVVARHDAVLGTHGHGNAATRYDAIPGSSVVIRSAYAAAAISTVSRRWLLLPIVMNLIYRRPPSEDKFI